MDRTQMLKVLVPVCGLALLLIVVAAVIALSDPSNTPPTVSTVTDNSGPPKRRDLGPPIEDGASVPKYAFALDAPEWKDIGGGLKIWDVKEGTGKECPPGASVEAQYTGWLVDGSSFDNPVKHGPRPIPFSLNEVVVGWQKGIPGMKIGGVRRLYIPGPMGYPAGRPGIPPNADLIFEVELTAVR
jgi:hypothetical protein